MADKEADALLRESATARGFRLVKSRRRKPGGDFGRYGLADLKTKRECYGFAADGLTATPDDIRAYLRGGEAASWKRSLIGVVGKGDKPSAPPKPSTPSAPSARPRSSARPGPRPSVTVPQTPARPERSRRARSATHERTPARKNGKPKSRASTSLEAGPSGDAGATDREPALALRSARKADAPAIAALIGARPGPLAKRLDAAIRAKRAPIIAERGGLVGILSWTRVEPLDADPFARVTLIHVAQAERRHGIGTALVEDAARRIARSGLDRIELLLDLSLDAPAGFLRRTGWTRAASGYGRAAG